MNSQMSFASAETRAAFSAQAGSPRSKTAGVDLTAPGFDIPLGGRQGFPPAPEVVDQGSAAAVAVGLARLEARSRQQPDTRGADFRTQQAFRATAEEGNTRSVGRRT